MDDKLIEGMARGEIILEIKQLLRQSDYDRKVFEERIEAKERVIRLLELENKNLTEQIVRRASLDPAAPLIVKSFETCDKATEK